MGNLSTQVHEILRASGAFCCVECGKCVAVCPMPDMYHNFCYDMSPRGLVKIAQNIPRIVEHEHIWYCTECNACSETCPEGVSCRDMVQGLKKIAISQKTVTPAKTCCSCGAVYTSIPISAYLSDRLKGRLYHYMDLCLPCRMSIYLRRNA